MSGFIRHLLALVLTGVAALTAAAQSEPAEVHAPAVLKIFERSCAQCHDVAQRSRPKGGFGYVLDLERLKTSEYVVAGEPDKSELYLYLIDKDPDVLMPPPDSDAPPLSAKEIETVRAWITGLAGTKGAGTGVSAGPTEPPKVGPAAPSPAVEVRPEAAKTPPSMDRVFARTHPMVVHFPMAS